MVASLVRGLDLAGKGYQLAKKGKAVELRLVPLSEESSQVSLTVDVASDRAGWFWGLGIGAGIPLTLVAMAIIVEAYEVPNVLALGAPGLLGVTISLARAGYRRAVDKMRLVLDVSTRPRGARRASGAAEAIVA